MYDFFVKVHNTYFLSSPVCQACLIDLYRKMTEQFRPELFDDSENFDKEIIHSSYLTEDVVTGRLFLFVFTYMFLWLT
jgi:hypothetical protein